MEVLWLKAGKRMDTVWKKAHFLKIISPMMPLKIKVSVRPNFANQSSNYVKSLSCCNIICSRRYGKIEASGYVLNR